MQRTKCRKWPREEKLLPGNLRLGIQRMQAALCRCPAGRHHVYDFPPPAPNHTEVLLVCQGLERLVQWRQWFAGHQEAPLIDQDPLSHTHLKRCALPPQTFQFKLALRFSCSFSWCLMQLFISSLQVHFWFFPKLGWQVLVWCPSASKQTKWWIEEAFRKGQPFVVE